MVSTPLGYKDIGIRKFELGSTKCSISLNHMFKRNINFSIRICNKINEVIVYRVMMYANQRGYSV